MADPTGRWVNSTQWQCPRCAWVNGSTNARCQNCGGSVRPPQSEPARPPDPLDLIGHDANRVKDAGLVELATRAAHSLTRVTHEKAVALIGHSLRNALRKRGEKGDQAWQAIAGLAEEDQRAALGYMVDELEEEGFALYRIDGDGPAGPPD
jgi:hypothetical protein